MRTPKEIKRQETGGITITWADGLTQFISSETLRRNCPSAVSRAQRGDMSHEKPLGGIGRSRLTIIDASLDKELSLEQIWVVGNYAVGMRWGDGHDTGIYTFDLLYSLGSEQAATKTAL